MGALLALQERFARHKFTYRLTGFGLGKAASIVSRHPRAIVGIWLLLTVAAAIRVSQVEFSEDLSKLRAKSSPAVRLQSEISAEVGGSFKDWVIYKKVVNSAEALEFSGETWKLLSDMMQRGAVSSASSLLDFVPSLNRQKANLRRLAELRESASHSSMVADFEAAAFENGLRMSEGFRTYIEQISQAQNANALIDFRNMAQDKQLLRLMGRFLRVESDGLHVACHLSPSEQLSNKDDALRFADELQEGLGAGASITSTPYLIAQLKGTIARDIWTVAILALIAVLGVLIAHFRRPLVALVAIVPLLCAVVMMLAAASLLGIDLNPVNLFIIPMILGIGIDDGIHIVHRFVEGKGRVTDTIKSTGKALVLTSLTTILAFGTLVFAGFEALAQIGVFTIIGVGCALLASITFLPALLSLYTGKKVEVRSR